MEKKSYEYYLPIIPRKYYYYYYIRLTAILQDNLGELAPER